MSTSEQSFQLKQPPQHQAGQPGNSSQMVPQPDYMPKYPGAHKLEGKVALVTGGDSGIGRAVAIAFAREGADVAIAYLNEHDDANETKMLVEKEGRECFPIAGDLGSKEFCNHVIGMTIERFGNLDILVNNAAEQHSKPDIEDISEEQLERTFRTNLFAFFFLTQASLPYLKQGSSIINTASVTAYKGKATLLDYSSTKGGIIAYTRSLSQALVDKGIRVNAVAPGPIWTPLIPATFSSEQVAQFGTSTPMKRAGQPNEVAPSYVFLASEDASYISGQVIHPNGGTIVSS
jgi:NAD(P)-dependent dehydrogenase (short-subunit alcohol dehydrogenase family)